MVLKPFRGRGVPSPAMAVAVVALVFAVTGVASGQLPNPLPLQDPAPAEQHTTIVRSAQGVPGPPFETRVMCEPDERATGGGAGTLDNTTRLARSQPLDRQGNIADSGDEAGGWLAVAQDSLNFSRPVEVFVICER
jgi:hypothetical protein